MQRGLIYSYQKSCLCSLDDHYSAKAVIIHHHFIPKTVSTAKGQTRIQHYLDQQVQSSAFQWVTWKTFVSSSGSLKIRTDSTNWKEGLPANIWIFLNFVWRICTTKFAFVEFVYLPSWEYIVISNYREILSTKISSGRQKIRLENFWKK